MAREDTVTMTREDLRKLISDEVAASTKLIAQGAADATVSVQRGMAGIQGQLATMEERTSVELGKPIPTRRPFEMFVQHCYHPRLGCKFDAFVKVRRHDADGAELATPVLSVTRLEFTEWPADLVERCKLPADSKESGPGAGGKRVRFSDEMDRHWTIAFLQWVADTYTKPLTAELASGADPVYLRPYAVGEPVPVDLGEIRRAA